MFTPAGEVRDGRFQTLAAIIAVADHLEMVIELTLFSQEKEPNLPISAQERAARAMADGFVPTAT